MGCTQKDLKKNSTFTLIYYNFDFTINSKLLVYLIKLSFNILNEQIKELNFTMNNITSNLKKKFKFKVKGYWYNIARHFHDYDANVCNFNLFNEISLKLN